MTTKNIINFPQRTSYKPDSPALKFAKDAADELNEDDTDELINYLIAMAGVPGVD